MRLPFTPIGTTPDQTSALRLQCVYVDTESDKCGFTPIQQSEAIGRVFNELKLRKGLGESDTESPGQMVIAAPGISDRIIVVTSWSMTRCNAGRQGFECFQGLGDFVASQAVVSVPSLAFHGDHPCLGQSCQMTTGRIRGDASDMCQFRGG